MHEPVLLQEVLVYLSPRKGDLLMDATAGYGGHAQAILDITKHFQDSVLVDRDKMAISYLRTQFAHTGIKIMHSDFYTAAKQLAKQGRKFDLILADLGVSSPHLNMASRGFSFSNKGPLDMRMDQRQSLTAADIVNQWNPQQIETIIRRYGEEPLARKITKSIVASRPILTTEDLVNIIVRASGKWRTKHPATRTFQALRIAVNDELGQLEAALPVWLQLLSPGGRLGVISFHSLEDRIVKRFLADHAGDTYDAVLSSLHKGPIVASRQEIVHNPRSRSAKLRIVVKINTTERTSDEN